MVKTQNLSIHILSENEPHTLIARAQKIEKLEDNVALALYAVDSQLNPPFNFFAFEGYANMAQILDKDYIKSNIIEAETLARKLEPSAKTTLFGFNEVSNDDVGKFEDQFGVLLEQLPQVLERNFKVIPPVKRSGESQAYVPPGFIIK